MPDLLENACAATLPARSLPALAAVRDRPGIRVSIRDGRALVAWDAGQEDVVRLLIGLPGVEFFEARGDFWHRPGASLPDFEASRALRESAFEPLARALVPGPIRAEPPSVIAPAPVPLRLVSDDRPRPARAMRTTLDALADWADRARTADFEGLSAAASGPDVLVLGDRLPTIPRAVRYWGRRVLAPLGRRPEPELPESAWAGALGGSDEDLVLLEEDGVEVVPLSAFGPLTRASVRLAREGQDA
jgi:hypothetical protein